MYSISPEALAASRWLNQGLTTKPIRTSGYPGVEENEYEVKISKKSLEEHQNLADYYLEILRAIRTAYLYDESTSNYVIIQITDNRQRFRSLFHRISSFGDRSSFASLRNATGLTGTFGVKFICADMSYFGNVKKAEESIQRFSLFEVNVPSESEKKAEKGEDLLPSGNGEFTYFDTEGKATAITLALGVEMEPIDCPGIVVYPFKLQLTNTSKDSCKSGKNLKMLFSLVHFLCKEEINDFEELNDSTSVFVEVFTDPKLTFDLKSYLSFNKGSFIQIMMNQSKPYVKLEKQVRFSMFIVDTKYLGGSILATKIMNNMRQQFVDEETNQSDLIRQKCMIELSSLDMCENIETVSTVNPNITSEWIVSLRKDYLKIPLLEAVHARLYGAVAVQLCVRKFPNVTNDSGIIIRCEIRNPERFFRFDLKGPLTHSAMERVYLYLARDIVQPFPTNKFTVRAVIVGSGGLKSAKEAEEYLNSQAEEKKNVSSSEVAESEDSKKKESSSGNSPRPCQKDGFARGTNGELTYWNIEGNPTSIILEDSFKVETIHDKGLLSYNVLMKLTEESVNSCKQRQNMKMFYSAIHYLCNFKINLSGLTDESTHVFIEFNTETKAQFDLTPLTQFNKDFFINKMLNQNVKIDKQVRFVFYVLDVNCLGGRMLAERFLKIRQSLYEEKTNPMKNLARIIGTLELMAPETCKEINLVADRCNSSTTEWNITLKNNYAEFIPKEGDGYSRFYGAIATKLCVKQFPQIVTSDKVKIKCEIRLSGRCFLFDYVGPLTSEGIDIVYEKLAKEITQSFASNKLTLRAVVVDVETKTSAEESQSSPVTKELGHVSQKIACLVLDDSYKVVGKRTTLSTSKSRVLLFKVKIDKHSLNGSNVAGICHELIEANGQDLPERKQKLVIVVLKMGNQSFKAVLPSKEDRNVSSIERIWFQGKEPKITSEFELEVQYRLLK